MSTIKQEAGVSKEEDEVEVTLDEATKRAFGNEAVGPAPASAPRPYFEVGDPVQYKRKGAYNDPTRGGFIKAVAWVEKSKSHVYKLETIEYKPAAGSFSGTDLVASEYVADDVVMVEAFGDTSDRIIENVKINSAGLFYYGIAGGFAIRDEDIVGLRARLC